MQFPMYNYYYTSVEWHSCVQVMSKLLVTLCRYGLLLLLHAVLLVPIKVKRCIIQVRLSTRVKNQWSQIMGKLPEMPRNQSTYPKTELRSPVVSKTPYKSEYIFPNWNELFVDETTVATQYHLSILSVLPLWSLFKQAIPPSLSFPPSPSPLRAYFFSESLWCL